MDNAIPQLLILMVVGICLAFGAAILWMLYLIKLATNEDELLRKIMEQQRRREEKRRAEEDKRRKRKEAAAQSNMMKAQLGGGGEGGGMDAISAIMASGVLDEQGGE